MPIISLSIKMEKLESSLCFPPHSKLKTFKKLKAQSIKMRLLVDIDLL